jgi:hypothetical protein
VHVAAGDVQRLMMLADRVLIRAFQQAIDLAVGVVVKLDLPHPELVGSAIPGPLRYLIDGFLRKQALACGAETTTCAKIPDPARIVP